MDKIINITKEEFDDLIEISYISSFYKTKALRKKCNMYDLESKIYNLAQHLYMENLLKKYNIDLYKYNIKLLSGNNALEITDAE